MQFNQRETAEMTATELEPASSPSAPVCGDGAGGGGVVIDAAVANRVLYDLNAWFVVTGLAKPTQAEVNSMVILTADRGIDLTADDWAQVWKLGGKRLAEAHAILCGHFDGDSADDAVAEVVNLLQRKSPC